MQDTTQLKNKIISIIEQKGPTLPVHIAKEINQNILFTSVFLSELLSEKKIKTTNMKVGSSPIYFLSKQENQLEQYAIHLKSKEKDAFELLKEKQILQDKTQEPAIRVALRAIKDFAIPFEKNNELYWKYLTANEKEFVEEEKENSQEKKEEPKSEIPNSIIQEVQKQQSEELNIFDKKEVEKEMLQSHESNKLTNEKLLEKPKKKVIKKKSTKKKTDSKVNDKFFNSVKEFLKEKNIEIKEIESIGKKELVFSINKDNQELLLFAHNKKQIKEEDLINANKTASEQNKKYIILSFGEPLKRVTNLIDAIKNLKEIKTIK